MAISLFMCGSAAQAHAEAATADTGTRISVEKVDEQRLIGRWIRPDGGYVIDIRSARPDGILDAFYYNPNPIYVSRAEWSEETGNFSIFIELTDKNYPGATYKLRYDPGSDRLAGEYF